MSNIFQVATKQSITEHVDYNHVHSNVNEKELRQLRLQCINYRCMVCADDFEIKSDLTTHMETEHRDVLYTKKSDLRRNFVDYSIVEGSSPKEQILEAKPLRKERIPKKFVSKTAKGASKFLHCPQCAFKTIIHWNLKVHLGTHIGAKFSCTLCDEGFKRKFDLTEHIRARHPEQGERQQLDTLVLCSCEVCDISGQSVAAFDQHLHSVHNLPHSGADPSGGSQP